MLLYCKCLQGNILVNEVMIRIGIGVVIILTWNWPCMLITCIPYKVLELFWGEDSFVVMLPHFYIEESGLYLLNSYYKSRYFPIKIRNQMARTLSMVSSMAYLADDVIQISDAIRNLAEVPEEINDDALVSRSLL